MSDGDAGEDTADPFDELDSEGGDPVEEPDFDDEYDDPFEELTEDASADDGLFTEVDVDGIDDDRIWEALFESETSTSVATDQPSTAAEGSTSDETVVSKERYCQQCEHFSSPPRVACDNPDTEILELVDADQFRVRNCPVVERRREATGGVLPDA